MKKAVYTKNGMKQIIDSGFKLFDKQTNCISYGNVIANTQYSSYIRPWKRVECNGHTFREGHLLNTDIQHFGPLPRRIRDLLYDPEREKSVILYEFFVHKEYVKDIIGWVVTTGYEDDYKKLMQQERVTWNRQLSQRINALHAIVPYISNRY